nr:DoxX family protein [Brevundimonas lenta]
MLRLDGLARGQDAALGLFRLYLGGFLVWGVWDNITSAARMAEFEAFLRALDCPWPALAAPASVWAQLLIGALLIPGFLTRWAGLLLTINFTVAVWLLGRLEAPAEAVAREQFGPMMCVLAGFLLATHGAGKLSLDGLLRKGR